jgi:hypothetical protein
MINELPTEVSYSYKNIFLYICLFLLVAGVIGITLYFLIFRKKSCKADKDCKSGQTCNGGKCQSSASGCKDDSDCASGNTCVNGQCQQVAPAASGCGADKKCAEGNTCVNGKCQPLPTTEVTLKNYDDTQSGDVDVLAYYKFISPVNNCKIKNITVHASGDVNNNGFILCAVNLKDGKEIYDSTKAVKFLDKYPNIPGDTSFSGNIDTDIMDVTLNHMENIPILNKEDFIYINWTTNNPKNPYFPKDPYGKIHTYKTKGDNNLAVSLTYTY